MNPILVAGMEVEILTTSNEQMMEGNSQTTFEYIYIYTEDSRMVTTGLSEKTNTWEVFLLVEQTTVFQAETFAILQVVKRNEVNNGKFALLSSFKG